MNKEKSVEILNDLIEINNDRIQGYETAFKETEHPKLLELFNACMNTSKAFKNELTAEILELNEQPTDSTRISGKLYRAWMDIKATFTGYDKLNILNSCEFGEDAIRDVYKNVLANEASSLNTAHLLLISKQAALLSNDHDKVKQMVQTYQSSKE